MIRQKILDSSDTLFKNVKAPITVTGKRLLDGEETEIEEMIKAKTDLEVKIERPKQMGLATINNIFTKEDILTALNKLNISETARSESLTNKQIIELANILTK